MPTETTAPRLIDANALKSSIRNEVMTNCPETVDELVKLVISLLDSAPTVETTDDVMKRLPVTIRDGIMLQCGYHEESGRWFAGYFDGLNTAHPSEVGFGETKLEAVKKLEESINLK